MEENTIICGDCLEVMKDWPDGCVDLVLTDPPYHKEYLHLWEPLALSSGRLLIDGGLLVTLTGHHSFNVIVKGMTKHLDFYWIGGMPSTSGFVGRYHPRQMMCTAKPVLWLSKGKPNKHEYVFDYFLPKLGNTKEYHDWGQPVGWFLYYINKLTKPNDLILDPFCGSGTTCVAAKMLGRRYIGIDISEEYCQIAEDRLMAVDTGVPVKEARAGQGALFER